LLDLEIDQNKAAEAFQLAERAKLITLKEMLSRSRVRITKGMTPAEQDMETRLTNRLISTTMQLERQEEQGRSTDAALQKLRAERRSARVEYETFIGKIYEAHSDLKLYRGEIAPFGFPEAGTLLRSDKDGLLEFAIGESNTYLFVLTDQRPTPEVSRRRSESALVLKAYPLNITGKELTERIDRFHQLMLNRDELVRESGRELYDLLLKPAELQLAGKTRLTIVPDGALWELPFEALQPTDDQFLIDSRTISYAPSLSALREMRKRADRRVATRPGPSTLVAFGSPLIGKQVSERLNLTYASDAPDLSDTANSALEKIKSIYGVAGEVVSGSDATEDRLRAEVNRRSVIHLDTPVLLDDVAPMYSTMVLSAGKTDGLFPIGQLLPLNSAARACVIPSAETLPRTGARGKAVLAVSWAWFVAGTPTVVLGRWPIESGSRERLMVELHRKLKVRPTGSATMAEALRESALAVRRTSQYQHPYYWSGFAAVGDAR
jgi:CHAT domain-containing protein